MRASQKSPRARGRGGRKPNGNNINRVYESAGPEGKVRGTPQQIIDKYQSLARDAQTAGDRVVAENFLQHAEHYQRILIEAMGARQERRDAQFAEQDQPETGIPGDGAAADALETAQAAGDRRRGAEFRGDGRGDGAERRSVKVSGLTTIDASDGDAGSLLVDAEEISASQPPRRRRMRDADPEPAAAAESAEADTQAE